MQPVNDVTINHVSLQVRQLNDQMKRAFIDPRSPPNRPNIRWVHWLTLLTSLTKTLLHVV